MCDLQTGSSLSGLAVMVVSFLNLHSVIVIPHSTYVQRGGGVTDMAVPFAHGASKAHSCCLGWDD